MAGTLIKLSVFVVFLVVLLCNSEVVLSNTTTEPTISASPGVLPYVTAPGISSFFPPTTPTSANQPMNSEAAPEAEEPAPAPSSGEFEGKKSSTTSARLDNAATIVAILLSSFLISSIVVV